jgi:hypothetical protein
MEYRRDDVISEGTIHSRNLNKELGLIPGQKRKWGEGLLAPDAGWFDKRGMFINHGDLSIDDFRHIASTIPMGELFLVLDSPTWERYRGTSTIDAIIYHIRYIMSHGRFFYVSVQHEEVKEIEGIIFEVIRLEDVQRFIETY